MNLKDKMTPLKGYFRIETYDKHDKLINVYEDNNRIMVRVPYNFACVTYGMGCAGFGDWPSGGLNIEDLAISCIAIGTDGVDDEGELKEVSCDRDMLYSEENLWQAQATGSISELDIDMDKYVYQTSFDTNINPINNDDMVKATKSSEGPSFPWDFSTNYPKFYRMSGPGNGLEFEDTSMTVLSKIDSLELKYEFTLGQFAGNGVWMKAPTFNEAALYMRYIPTSVVNQYPSADILGAMFSMKTFPNQYKTEACYFRIKWNIIFGESECTKDSI